MKKYFLYELKKHLWTLIILTAVCALPYIVSMATFTMWYEWEDWETGVTKSFLQSPNVSLVFWELLILLFVVPKLLYSFKMSKRGVDGYYSLPLRKEKLYFVLTMVGLILVIVPYTVSYWLGFLTLLIRKGNPYQMGYFVPAYFVGVLFALFLYGVNAFVFTRANRTSDGVVFMLSYAIVGYLAVTMIDSVFLPIGTYIPYSIESSFLFSGGMFEYVNEVCRLILGEVADYEYAGWWFGLPIGAGIVCYSLLFYTLRFEKGENAEQTSESWFGYKTLIPVYTALMVACCASDPLSLILVLVGVIVATMIYKHSFRLKLKDFYGIGIGFAVGLILMIIAG